MAVYVLLLCTICSPILGAPRIQSAPWPAQSDPDSSRKNLAGDRTKLRQTAREIKKKPARERLLAI